MNFIDPWIYNICTKSMYCIYIVQSYIHILQVVFTYLCYFFAHIRCMPWTLKKFPGSIVLFICHCNEIIMVSNILITESLLKKEKKTTKTLKLFDLLYVDLIDIRKAHWIKLSCHAGRYSHWSNFVEMILLYNVVNHFQMIHMENIDALHGHFYLYPNCIK